MKKTCKSGKGILGALRLGCFVFLVLPLSVGTARAQASVQGQVIAITTTESIAAARIILQGHRLVQTESDAQGGFRFPAVDPGEYQLSVEAAGYFTAKYELVLRPRQALSLTVDLVPLELESLSVAVQASYTDLDPEQTGTSRILTRQKLESLPAPLTRDLATLAENLVPGTLVGHDNFVHIRGNELSLHQFINGVSFLDNSHQHFTAGLNPQIFESVNFITGGFPAEFGNRFGGILDITTRSGRTLDGHGSATLGMGTVLDHNAAVDFGGSVGRWGYYFYASGSESGRFLNPPTPHEIHDLGYGARGAVQLDFQGDKDVLKLLLTGGGTNLQLPNTEEEATLGRDAFRRIRSQTAILTWQHVFSARTSLATSVYERNVSDRLLPTTDPVTPFGEGSRSTLTMGAKSDLTFALMGHTFKSGIDLSALRLRESFLFDPREPENEAPVAAVQGLFARSPDLPIPHPPLFSSAGHVEALFFSDHDVGGQISLYFQDRFSLFRNFSIDTGLRWDQINIVGSEYQISPRVALAYHFPQTETVLHFAYNRLFTPPPLEYALLASHLGNEAAEEERAEGHEDVLLGNVRAYTQDYYEVGWSQRLHAKLMLELNAYHHRGENAFETAEISNTRLFLPSNFQEARASGVEISLVLRQLERLGLDARFQYALSRIHFFGPISGGFPGEELEPGERILPAFDQTHTGTANIFFRNDRKNFWTGFNFRYGSGTPVEEEVEVNGEEVEQVVRLPQHLSADFSSGITLWEEDSRRVELEFNITNLSNNIYRIAKESETTPFQFAPRRVVSGRLKWHF